MFKLDPTKMISSDYTIMTVDPGIRGTGLCIWEKTLWCKKPANPLYVTNLMPQQYEDWQKVCRRFYEEISEVISTFNVLKCWVEFPQFFQSEVGMAATTKGDIYKLSCLVGVFEGAMWSYGGQISPIEVRKWKGQLSKDIVIQRIKKTLPDIEQLNVQSHSWDAIGIGLWAQGFINK